MHRAFKHIGDNNGFRVFLLNNKYGVFTFCDVWTMGVLLRDIFGRSGLKSYPVTEVTLSTRLKAKTRLYRNGSLTSACHEAYIIYTEQHVFTENCRYIPFFRGPIRCTSYFVYEKANSFLSWATRHYTESLHHAQVKSHKQLRHSL